MLALLCLAVSAAAAMSPRQQVSLPNNHDLRIFLDQAFRNMDLDHDGTVDQAEWDNVIMAGDADSDGCVTLAEYLSPHAGTDREIYTALYHHFDFDHNGCLNVIDMQHEFRLMDQHADGQLTMHEWDHYMIKILTHLFPHHG
ncbi:uncharacterized protein LOC127834595 [Dreissena polymorpha]|uniref:EF-hand domain-containing protein n=1 Tax=Dreissena polymorpha TaxID=45954 RepID=A0A9D4JDN5_DREPO|nr:uncharacterized protein LOC127834595 [Dreissena polymorpha]KAH3804783.1 hypothetical protein DPMN_133071 [Dreissena polymorpha]